MKCPKCQTDNPEGMKFCGGCGTKLERVCPNCNFSNPPQFRFCGECGHDLTLPSKPTSKELSFDEKITKIQKYLPGGLTEKILAQRGRIEGERKQVTVLFCDMENFTPLVEKLGHEEAFMLMDKVYEILIHKVHEFEGTVNDLSGDGMMALFGAPIALEDAPQRAIRSALAIHREITQFSDRMKQEKGIPAIRMRVGIHTGPVVVGALGNDLRVQFTAVGDTVNLASRVQNLADPGTTYVTEDTFKLTEGFFRFEALGEKKVKGKEEPVRVYQVIAPSTRRTKFDVSAERGLTPFIGRERELELLLDGFKRVKAGKGQAFSIISEAGVGKSRLLYEFRKTVANEDVNFLEGKCLSYGRGAAYHPVIDILKSTFQIQEGERDQGIREKVKKGLALMGVDEPSTLPYLLELLSVKDSGIDQISMSPEAKKDRISEAIKRIVLKGSEIRPLIIAFEDLHWVDKSSEDVVRSHLESIPGSRVLLIFTYRPEFVHTWGAKSYHNQLTLHRLSNRESLEIATHILGTKAIEKTLEELILEKTEGVPFFVEEFIKSLRDLKIVERKDKAYRLIKDVRQVAIPSTIQDVIMARVDSLPERAKEVLQIGSAIEREFSYLLIDRLTGLPEKELLSNLSILKDSELLYERGIYPQSNYIFKHALTREVVYDSLLAAKRKRFHEEIGKSLEELYQDHLTDHYDALARHYLASENHQKAAHYSHKAARKAEKSASFPEAIAYEKQRVMSLERLPDHHPDRRKLIEARTMLGLFMAQIFDFREAKSCIEPVIALASEVEDRKRLCQMQTILGCHHHWVGEDFANAFKNLEGAVRTSMEIGDVVSMFFASQWLGYAYGFCCQFDKAEKSLEKALEINFAANNLWGVCAIKSSIAYCVQLARGDISSGYETTEQAVSIAEKSGDVYSKAIAYVMHGFSTFQRGLIDDASEYLTKGIKCSEKTNFRLLTAHGRFILGHVHFVLKRYRECINQYVIAEQIWKECDGLPSLVRYIQLATILARVCSGKEKVEKEFLFQVASQNRLALHEGSVWRCVSNILIYGDGGALADAQYAIERAIEADVRNDTKWSLAMDHATYAYILGKGQHLRESQENLDKATDIFRKCGAEGWAQRLGGEKLAIEETANRAPGAGYLFVVP